MALDTSRIILKYVWLHTGEFDKFKQTNRNGVSLYYSDNLSFYNRLKSQGIKIVSGENAFDYII